MQIEPIAYFHSPFGTKFGIPRQAGLAEAVPGQIVFEPKYRSEDAVRGLEEFDYLWIVWEFSANRKPDLDTRKAPADKTAFQATVRPPRLGGNERIGVFASRSPFRPNSLGLSSVRIRDIEYDSRGSDGKPNGPVINVLGADLMDGTPIYDIKPYVTYADSHPEARSGFVDKNDWQPLKVVFPEGAEKLVSDLKALEEVLAQDPRPRYKEDGDKEYGMLYEGMDVHFYVKDNVLTVKNITFEK